MHWDRSKRIGMGVMALLIAVFFISAVARALPPGEARPEMGMEGKGGPRPLLGIWRDARMVRELNLSAEQVTKLREADYAFGEKFISLKSRLDSLDLQMDKAFSEEAVDDAVVLSLAKKISEVRGEIFVLEIESRLAFDKLLTKEQILRLNQPERHRRMPAPKREQEQADGPETFRKLE